MTFDTSIHRYKVDIRKGRRHGPRSARDSLLAVNCGQSNARTPFSKVDPVDIVTGRYLNYLLISPGRRSGWDNELITV